MSRPRPRSSFAASVSAAGRAASRDARRVSRAAAASGASSGQRTIASAAGFSSPWGAAISTVPVTRENARVTGSHAATTASATASPRAAAAAQADARRGGPNARAATSAVTAPAAAAANSPSGATLTGASPHEHGAEPVGLVGDRPRVLVVSGEHAQRQRGRALEIDLRHGDRARRAAALAGGRADELALPPRLPVDQHLEHHAAHRAGAVVDTDRAAELRVLAVER